MNKFDRVFSILILLQTKKRLTASSIADRFDISQRTVYRDIKTLKNAGVPIIGDPGLGYTLLDGFRMMPLSFNENEVLALYAAEKVIGKITDQETLAQYKSAMMKIRAILKRSEKQSLETLDESIEIAPHNNAKQLPILNDLFRSIASKNIIQIHYTKENGNQTDRMIEPIGCYLRYNQWYVAGYCQLKQAYRTFKVSRITTLRVSLDKFYTKHISLKEYIDQQNKDWNDQQVFVDYEIAFDKTHLQYAENRKHYFGFIEKFELNDRIHMKFHNSSIEFMARWLIQFGKYATVIEPNELKEEIKFIAQDLLNHYD